MGQMRMTDAGTTQDNFILPEPPVGGLPISQDWLNRMKLVQDRTVPIILPSGKDILSTKKGLPLDVLDQSGFLLDNSFVVHAVIVSVFPQLNQGLLRRPETETVQVSGCIHKF